MSSLDSLFTINPCRLLFGAMTTSLSLLASKGTVITVGITVFVKIPSASKMPTIFSSTLQKRFRIACKMLFILDHISFSKEGEIVRVDSVQVIHIQAERDPAVQLDRQDDIHVFEFIRDLANQNLRFDINRVLANLE